MLRSFLLLTLLVLPSGAFAQTVQAGLSYDEGAAQLVIHARTTGDLSGEGRVESEVAMLSGVGGEVEQHRRQAAVEMDQLPAALPPGPA